MRKATLLKKLNKEEYGKDFEPNRSFLIATIELMVWNTTSWLKNGASVILSLSVNVEGFKAKKSFSEVELTKI